MADAKPEPKANCFVMLVMIVVCGCLLIATAEFSRSLVSFLPLLIYLCLVFFAFVANLGGRSMNLEEFSQLSGGRGNSLLLHLSYAILGVICFGLLCRELAAVGAGFVGAAENSAASAWIAYSFDNLLEAILLDIPGIYDLHLTKIEPTTFFSRTVVFIYRLAIDVAIIAALVRFTMHRFQSESTNEADIAPSS